MKLRTKIILLVTAPLLLLGLVIYLIGSNRITAAMTNEVKDSLKATAISVRDTVSVGMEGDYHVVDGDLWKGEELNISQNEVIADSITEKTDIAVTVFYGDTRYMTSVINNDGDRVLGTKASDRVIQEVLVGGEDLFATNVDVVGEKFFVYYLPLYNESSSVPVGMVFAGKSQEDVEANIQGIWNTLLAVIVLITVLFILVAFLFAAYIAAGLDYSVKRLGRVAQGDLLVQINEKKRRQKDEVGDILNAVAKMKETLSDIIGEIVSNSNKIHLASTELDEDAHNTSSTVEQVEEAVNEIAMGATSQAQETQRATEHVVVMGQMVEQANEEVMNLQHNSLGIKQAGDAAAQKLMELQQINTRAHTAINEIYEQTHTTHDSAQKIREVVEVITSIAEETNLLSLNASIEAARAGEQGRGFAVVAAQIQKLAEQSNRSAKEIGNIVTALIHDSERAVMTMDEVQGVMKSQNRTVEETGTIVTNVIQGIDTSVDSITAIAERTEKLDAERVQVVDVVQNLTAIAEENAASTEETSASAARVSEYVVHIGGSVRELAEVAEELKSCTNKFIVEETATQSSKI